MVHLTNASQIRFESCTFRASGGYGFWADHGTHRVSFVNNLATDLGAGAVRLGRGSSVVQPGECEGHTITDNVLQHGGCKMRIPNPPPSPRRNVDSVRQSHCGVVVLWCCGGVVVVVWWCGVLVCWCTGVVLWCRGSLP